MNRRTVNRFSATACWLLATQIGSGQDLAIRLADPELRQLAVRSITYSGGRDLALLLSWGENPPPRVDSLQLRLGLMEAFRKLRAKEAIPFLIRYMTLDIRGISGNVWTKADGVVETRLPAIDALIAIGPDASKAVIAALSDKTPPEVYVESLFIICKIADPAARDFLLSVHPKNPTEAYYVRNGLELIQQRHN